MLATGGQDPLVRLINPDNTSKGEVPLSAVPDGAAYAVRTIDSRTKRSHALALDFDAKTHPRAVDRHEADLIHSLLRRCGIRALMCESGPNSGFHVLVRITAGGVTPEGRKLLISGLGRLGLLTLDRSPLSGLGMIRPPGSPHRLGGRSQVVGDPEEALADLVGGLFRA